MKKRLGYVSNSSSSSFVCEICGEATGGINETYEGANAFVCDELGFYMCLEHLDKDAIIESLLQDEEHDDDEFNADDEYKEKIFLDFLYEYGENIPKEFSPIYQLDPIPDSILLKCALKDKYGIKQDLVLQLKSKYNNMDEINNFLGDK